MMFPEVGAWIREYAALVLIVLAFPVCGVSATSKTRCARVVVAGDVTAGREWKAALGQGWVFRVLPISRASDKYSGWDLVVDREQPAGYPDALLLATMPYNSINEREIATTFELRAQDAIGWNPRSFHFLSDPTDFREGQQLFASFIGGGTSAGAKGNSGSKSPGAQAGARLLALQKHASSGEFRILDARLVPGVSDPASFAQGWALASARTPHQVEAGPAEGASALGRLDWIRFTITLWLPDAWKLPGGLRSTYSACPE